MNRNGCVIALLASVGALACSNEYVDVALGAFGGSSSGAAAGGSGASGQGGNGASGGAGVGGGAGSGASSGSAGSGGDGGASGSCGARLTIGSDHTCVRLEGGETRCWGANGWGQLGDGSTNDASQPVTPTGLGKVKYLATRFFHGCAALEDGTVSCWGQNDYSQLGGPNSYAPQPVGGLTGASEVGVGRSISCALIAGGVWCWGASPGNGAGATSASATQLGGISTAVEIAVGSGHACALLSDATARCWGSNVFGQIGDGTTTSTSTPVAVSFPGGIDQIVTNGFSTGGGQLPGEVGAQTCVLSSGGVKCWGDNFYGQLGNGNNTSSLAAVDVFGLTDAVEIAMGRHHVCARRAGGSVVCWGGNGYGQLGDGGAMHSSVPVPVQGIAGAVQLAASGWHSCAMLDDASVHCWGNDSVGQLGDGIPGGVHSTPVPSWDVCQ